MLGRIGMPELLFIFLAIVVLFGAKSLPEIARGLGQAIKIFKKEVRDLKDGVELDEVSKASEASLDSADVKRDQSNDFDPEKPRRYWRSEIDTRPKES